MPKTISPSLSKLQRWMRWVISHPEGVGPALTKRHPLNQCLSVIGQTPEVSREKRLAIYGNGYFARIVDVLGANFSSVKNVLGPDTFDEVARRYLVKHPSKFRSIDDIGHRFADFLRRQPAKKKYPFISDLAAVEWAAHTSFFSDDVAPITFEKLGSIPQEKWASIRFRLDPSVRFMISKWPVADLWRVDGKWSPARLKSMKKERRFILIFRTPDRQTRVRNTGPTRYDLLRQLKRKTLGNALRYVARKYRLGSEDLPVSAWFRVWVEEGILKF